VAAQSNELTAIPAVLQLLELKGGIGTREARGGQQASVPTSIKQAADSVLTRKANQGLR
jgi:hypothetical protein